MAIGTALAIGLGSAVLGAGSSILGASKNSKAINKATDAQTQANDASIGLQRDIYGQNKQALSPYMQRGNAAGDQINALLGLGGQQASPAQAAQPMQGFGQGYAQDYGGYGGYVNSGDFSAFASGAYGGYGGQAAQPMQQTMQQQPMQPGQTAAQAQTAGFDNFRNSTGYQFRLGEGMNALNSGYAAAGALQSGAAMRDAVQYGQNFASNEFGNYMGLLGNQQGVGLSGASALAGVGQNYANNVSNLNTQNATAIGQGAVAKANNSNAMIGGLASSIGGLAGQFGGGLFK